MAGKSMSDVPGESEEEDRPEAAEGSNFQFLNFTNFHQTKDPQTKSKVRSHVMAGVHQSKRSGTRKEKGGPITLDTSALLGPKSPATQQRPDDMLPPAVLPSPARLGSIRTDPFQQYPIEMNRRALELYDHLRGDFCVMFKTLSKIGFFRTITDAAGFYQILCTSVSHMTTLRALPVAESSEAIVLSTQAIQSVNSRLGDPVLSTSDGVVTAILAFCCHTIMFNDVPGSSTHLKGLEEIIRRRGGLGTLNSSPSMRMVLFWVDTNYAFMTDSVPRFPRPDDLLPTIDARPIGNATLRLAPPCATEDLTFAINDLYGLNQLIIDRNEGGQIWLDGLFAWSYVVPLLHRILSTKYDHPGQVAYRTGALLYIAAIRRRFGVKFLTHVQIRNLKDSMTVILQDIEVVGYDPSVLLWLLILGSTLSKMKEEHEWFVSKTAQLIFTMGYWSWEEAISYVRGVLWIDSLLQPELEALRQEISTIMWDSYRRLFS